MVREIGAEFPSMGWTPVVINMICVMVDVGASVEFSRLRVQVIAIASATPNFAVARQYRAASYHDVIGTRRGC